MKKYIFYHNRFWFWGTVLFQTLQTAMIVGISLILNRVLDSIVAKDPVRLTRVAMLCAAYALVVGAVVWAAAFFNAVFLRNAVGNLRRDLAAGLLRSDIPEFQKQNTASYLSLLNNDVATVRAKYFANLLAIIQGIVQAALAAAVLFSINWTVALAGTLFSVLPVLIPQAFGKRLVGLQEKLSGALARYNEKVKDIFSGFEVVKSYGIERIVLSSYETANREAASRQCEQENTAGLMGGLTNWVAVTVQFGIFVFSGFLSLAGVLTVGNIVAITQLVGRIVEPAFNLTGKFGDLKTVRELNRKMEAIVARPDAYAEGAEIGKLENGIEIRDLSFAYGDRNVLRDVNLTFEKGRKYAVVGRSGSGKSTLLKLLLRYYGGYEGEIRIDGREIRELSCVSLNRLCAVIHQNVFLFDDTLKNNISLYSGSDGQSISESVEKAGLSEILPKLPEGLETPVGENGGQFSGGEKQRVAIARAFLKGAGVLLLDEATASLDNETADEIEKTLLAMEGVTCIVVTHRYSADILRGYDEIVALKDGTVEETGTFDELMDRKGYFYSLYNVVR
jgi:ATP-binding cassette subfamily C protein